MFSLPSFTHANRDALLARAEEYMRASANDALREMTSRLTSLQREVILCIYILEMTEAVAAEVLGISQQAVSFRKSGALKKIARNAENKLARDSKKSVSIGL